MKILIDGDACPSISKIESLGKEYSIEVEIYCDINHYIRSDYAKVIVVDSGFQSADMFIMNNVKNKDIVITQDYGVAAICLPKGAKVLSPKGYIYSEDNIDSMLSQRHIHSKLRKAGVRTKGPKKRSIEDENRLIKNLRISIENNLKS